MSKGKILLVEQDEVNLMMTEMILSEFGYQVTTASGGEEAIRLLTESKYDLLLMDFIMHPMDGIETLSRIRETPEIQDINTVFLTVSAPRMDLSEALRLGVLDFIPNPVLPETLFSSVRQAMQVTSKEKIVAVDDDEMNLFTIREIFGIRYDIRCASSGTEALQEIEKERPDLVLLDFHMPEMDGIEVLQRIRDIEGCETLPVVFLTADTGADTEAVLFEAGAMDYIAKPFVMQVAMQRIHRILNLKHLQDSLKDEVDQKTMELRDSNQRLQALSSQIIHALISAVDTKDHYTNGHSDRVAEYSKEISRRLGKSMKEVNEIYNIALLHDIGKIGISDKIISKPSRLNAEEYEIIKSHTIKGYEILKTISEMPSLPIGARWHHERYDGSGYPDGKAGEDIPEVARIICIADAYDAMSSDRSYRKALPQFIVREEIEQGKGVQFDPKIADVMLQMIDEDTEYSMRGIMECH
ncbi:MAG: response regulator [Schwartzia sp.]|nr:response regulator [Schwartzia sp. (in: firmicutes)]